jgi:hypothetical protein
MCRALGECCHLQDAWSGLCRPRTWPIHWLVRSRAFSVLRYSLAIRRAGIVARSLPPQAATTMRVRRELPGVRRLADAGRPGAGEEEFRGALGICLR